MEAVSTGRMATVRIGANEDLVAGLTVAAQRAGFRWCVVQGGVGSLIDARIESVPGTPIEIMGPAIEVLSLRGEIKMDEDGDILESSVTALLGDTSGKAYGGKILAGQNLVCVTVEAVLEELAPADFQARN